MYDHTSVALGSFDGLHCGHMAVLRSAMRSASDGMQPLALLFDRHPLAVLYGQSPPMLLQTELRERILREMGFRIKTVSFAAIRDCEPETFVRDVLINDLRAGVVCCGYNYRFGRGGAGDAALLRELCARYGIEAHIASPVSRHGEPVSSTRIRRALESGDLPAVREMLGRPFAFFGEVIHGSENGRALGYPTANQLYPAGLAAPRFGVYASTVSVDGAEFRAITNIGVRPTVEDDTLLSETHILGSDNDLYGQSITVSLYRFIRPERKFDSLSDVFCQVRRDIETAYPDMKTNSEEINI